MTRFAHYRIAYLAVLALVVAGVYAALRAAGNDRLASAAAIVLLIVPGLIQGLFLRPLFRGDSRIA